MTTQRYKLQDDSGLRGSLFLFRSGGLNEYFLQPILDKKLVRCGRPLFLSVYSNGPAVLQLNEARFSIIF